jgi:SAM-dependent MidA family methyltransferase
MAAVAVGPAWPAIVERIHRGGPIPFSHYQMACLYGPGGFYTDGRGAGRRADFLTSPTVGPLFGAVLARAIDAEWGRHRRPDPWVVVEAAAGDGTSAAAVLEAGPECAGALRYVGVEVSPVLRDAAGQRLPVELAALVLGPRPPSSDPDADVAPVGRRGPLVTVLADLPAEPFTGMVVANELLDNLAVDLLEWRDGEWAEVRVGDEGNRPVEVLVRATDADVALVAELVGGDVVEDGARVPLQREAGRWLARALRVVDRGLVVCIDYCSSTTAALAARPSDEWLRTYRSHGRGGDVLASPGGQDVTCEVAVDQLARIRRPTRERSQAAWLAAHGLDGIVASARTEWAAAAGRPDLAALKARSRVGEAAALTDPSGLGGLRVLEWEVGVDAPIPERG